MERVCTLKLTPENRELVETRCQEAAEDHSGVADRTGNSVGSAVRPR